MSRTSGASGGGASLTVATSAPFADTVGTGGAEDLCTLALAKGSYLLLAEVAALDFTAEATPVFAWIGTLSQDATGALTSGWCDSGLVASGVERAGISLVTTLVLAAAATVYLTWDTVATVTAILSTVATGLGATGTGPSTGLTAVKYA